MTTTLYRFYNSAGLLLYVGVSGKAISRWAQHRADKPWWELVARTTVEHYPTGPAAYAAEAEAIRREWPLCNIQGHPRSEWARAVSREPRILALAQHMTGSDRHPDFTTYMSRLRELVGFRSRNADPWLATPEAFECVVRVLEAVWGIYEPAGLEVA